MPQITVSIILVAGRLSIKIESLPDITTPGILESPNLTAGLLLIKVVELPVKNGPDMILSSGQIDITQSPNLTAGYIYILLYY
jgi:hypothetical protein